MESSCRLRSFLAVAPELLTSGLIRAVALGLFGGVFPAILAARLPITPALRGE